MKAAPKREGEEVLSVFDLRSFLRAGRPRLSPLAGLYLDSIMGRLESGVTFAPGAPLVTCAVVEGQTLDAALVEKIDRHGFQKDDAGMPIFPAGALTIRVYLTLHETTRAKPKDEWVLLHEREDGARFFLLTRGEAMSRVFDGNLEVPFGHTDETDRWLACASEAVHAESERLAKETFEHHARLPATALLRRMLGSAPIDDVDDATVARALIEAGLIEVVEDDDVDR